LAVIALGLAASFWHFISILQQLSDGKSQNGGFKMKMKLFRYGYLIRIAFDHGRFIPIIMKQRGVSRIITVISSEIVDTPSILWTHLLHLNQKIAFIGPGQIMGL
jgi:hypothetical protein